MLRATILLGSMSLAGCSFIGPVTAPEHRAAVSDDASERLTLGRVQKEIRVGMGGAEVAAALGSPNIVTTDEQRREVWIYDRISTDSVHSSSRGGVSALLVGFGTQAAGGVAGGQAHAAGATSRSQRTFTVIVKFDEASRVRDFSYRTSRF